MRQPPAQERALALGVLQPPSPTSPRLEDEAVWRSPRSSLPAGPVISLSVRSSRFAAGWSPTFPIRHSGPFSPARSGRLRSRQTVRNWANATVAKRGTPTAPGNFRTYRSPPLTFVHHRRAGTRARARVARSPGADHPRRRCQEIKQISGEHAQSYARRHLRETGHDRTHWIVGYLCLVTDLTWQLKHREMPDGWRLPSLARLDGGQSPSASPKTVSTRRQGRSPQCR